MIPGAMLRGSVDLLTPADEDLLSLDVATGNQLHIISGKNLEVKQNSEEKTTSHVKMAS